jgi:uncharacterized membrane protein YcaP (DUF421 family)
MERDIFELGLPLTELVLRSVISLAAALVMVRLAVIRLDRPLDGIILALVAGALLTGIRGPDESVTGGLLVAGVTLAMFTLILSARARFPFFERFVEGGPVAVVRDGKLDTAQLRRTGMTDTELLALLSERGVRNVADVRLAIVDGSYLLVDSAHPVRDDDLAEVVRKLQEVAGQLARGPDNES